MAAPGDAVQPIDAALRRLARDESPTADESADAVAAIIDGQADEVGIAALLTALAMRGETAEVVAGAVRAVRERMTRLDVPGALRPLLDTCGTGGDGASTFNISTASAIVAAACGARVAKHGNRSASGRCGSAEVLDALGIAIEAPPDTLRRCLADMGIAFLMAPRFHPALRHAAPVRRRLPFRTLFNLVGPLANPAAPEYQIVGAPSERLAEILAGALAMLGLRRAAVVTGGDGLDEVTLGAPTRVLRIEEGVLRRETWTAEDFGLPEAGVDCLRIDGPADAAERLRRVLSGGRGPCRDVVLANASAALLVAERAESLTDGVAQASRAIDSGAAADVLERWVALSRAESAG
jgi:anthranilate phosphoribosyltransferase